MTEPVGGQPGRHLALSVVHPGSPVLRVRYRQGVLIGPYGYPDWLLCARAVVDLPPPDPRLTVDEIRVADVLAANLAMAAATGAPGGDPLWPVPSTADGVVATPAGWCWAHAGPTEPGEVPRRLALVPAELHDALRHAGGVGLLPQNGRGVRPDPTGSGPGVGAAPGDPVPADVLGLVDEILGWPLPPNYRRFLATSNGSGPATPAVCLAFGLVADQPLFGLGRDDQHQDVSYAAAWLRDRFTPDFLPIGYVQGGLLAVKVTPDDIDSIWYWDDDDPRDREDFDAAYICAHLLHRCADSIDDLFGSLVAPPRWLTQHARYWVDNGLVRPVRDPLVGAGLAPQWRAPWMAVPRAGRDPLSSMFEVA
ncbi:MAG TPA: SMI1/KNR4 family protein [Micromonosporaceae bacterium]|jgi:hypothetical protein